MTAEWVAVGVSLFSLLVVGIGAPVVSRLTKRADKLSERTSKLERSAAAQGEQLTASREDVREIREDVRDINRKLEGMQALLLERLPPRERMGSVHDG